MHCVPYAGHPGYNKTPVQDRKFFYQIGMGADIQKFVLSCPICQVEKSEHQLPKGQLQPLQLPEQKWEEVMIDFITKLPQTSRGNDSIFAVIDRVTKCTYVIPCTEEISAEQRAQMY